MYKDILLPLDLSEEHVQARALPVAIELCHTFKATLHVIYVVPSFGLAYVSQYFPEHTEEKMLEKATKQLRDFVDQHIPKDIPVQDIIGHGSIYKEIIAAAERIGADLILMATHKPEMRDHVIGPNASKVVDHAKCSVMVVRNAST